MRNVMKDKWHVDINVVKVNVKLMMFANVPPPSSVLLLVSVNIIHKVTSQVTYLSMCVPRNSVEAAGL